MVSLLPFMTVSYNLLNVFCNVHFRDNTFMGNVFMTSHNIVPLYFYQISKIHLFCIWLSAWSFTASRTLGILCRSKNIMTKVNKILLCISSKHGMKNILSMTKDVLKSFLSNFTSKNVTSDWPGTLTIFYCHINVRCG